MPKDEDLPRRIEAVFQRTGLGNSDAEKVSEFADAYDHLMAIADRIRTRKGKNFEEVLSITPEKPPEEES